MIRNEEWSTMRRLLLMHGAMGAPLKEYEAEGNPVAFNTNVAKPLTGFTIPFIPVQTGTDPSPDNVCPISGWSWVNAWRTGETLIDSTKRYVSSGSQVYIGHTGTGYAIELSAGTYTFAIGYKSSTGYDVLYKGESVAQARIINKGTVAEPYIATATFTISEDDTFRFWLYSSGGVSVDNVAWFTIAEGTDALIPATYPVTFPALGKNLFDVSAYPFTSGKWIDGRSGENKSNVNYKSTGFIPVELYAGLTVTLNKRPSGTNPGIGFYSTNSVSSFVSGLINDDGTGGSPWTFQIPSTAKYMRFTVDESETDIQIEKGQTATAYEPYTNTVYGGTLDAVNGVLTVEYAKITDDGSGSLWNSAPQEHRNRLSRSTTPKAKASSTSKMVCNYAKSRNSSGSSVWDAFIGSTSNFLIYVPSEIDTPQAWANYLSEHPIEFVYELDESYEIQLDPITVQTLIGDTTIWTDTNGSNTIKYKKKG